MNREEQALPKWIWNKGKHNISVTTISKRFSLTEDWHQASLNVAFTGAAIIYLNDQQIDSFEETPNNIVQFMSPHSFPQILPKGEYEIRIELKVSELVPLENVNSYLWNRRVGFIGYLTADNGWLATDESWESEDGPVEMICRLGEEPFGDLESGPEWFVEGGFGDIRAYSLPAPEILQVDRVDCNIIGDWVTLGGTLMLDADLHAPAREKIELFYHLRKQNDWKQMRQMQQALMNSDMNNVTLDMNVEYNARFYMENNGAASVTILWNGGESLHELDHYDGCVTEWFTILPGEACYTLPQGMRYVRLFFIGEAGSEFNCRIRFEAANVELTRIGQFHSTSEMLNQVYEVSAHTSKICHQIGLWDGIKRDRLNWTYDFYLAAKSCYFLWSDFEVLKRAVRELGVNTPKGYWMNGISEYTLWWVKTVCEYYYHTGDADFVLELKEPLQRHISWIEAHIDKQKGGIDAGFILIEWAPFKDSEKPVALQAILKMTKSDLEKLNHWIPELQLDFNWQLRELKDEDFIQPDHQIATQVLGIQSGYVSDAAARGFLESCTVQDPLTPLSSFMLAECYSNFNMHEQAYNVIQQVWGVMLERGATTFWESFTSELTSNYHNDLTTYGAYGSYRISLCHSWSSTPVKWMTEHILGIKSLEPGYKSVSISPAAVGGMTACEGTVGTPFGPIAVSWSKQADDELKCTIDLPPGIKLAAAAESEIRAVASQKRSSFL